MKERDINDYKWVTIMLGDVFEISEPPKSKKYKDMYASHTLAGIAGRLAHKSDNRKEYLEEYNQCLKNLRVL